MALHAWGANSYGQLGLAHQEDAWSPTLVRDLPFTNISALSGGGGHTVIISAFIDDGRIATCGNNSKGQLGIEPSTKHISSFTDISYLIQAPITSASCGWEHTLVVTSTGRVYAFGCNGYDQLGIDDQLAATSKPTLIAHLHDTVKTSCGLRHSMCLNRDGHVYCWGEGKHGQLGRKSAQNSRPMVVDIPEPVSDIAAGQHHSAALTRSGAVFVWGSNKYGQLGLSTSKTVLSKKAVQVCGLPKNIVTISSGWSHIIACTSDGQLFSWGRSNYGQLGEMTHGTSKGLCNYEPVLIKNFQCSFQNSSPILASGSEHNLALDTLDNELKSWGWNEHGMCGIGINSEHIISKPCVINFNDINDSVKQVACGSGHSLAFML